MMDFSWIWCVYGSICDVVTGRRLVNLYLLQPVLVTGTFCYSHISEEELPSAVCAQLRATVGRGAWRKKYRHSRNHTVPPIGHARIV